MQQPFEQFIDPPRQFIERLQSALVDVASRSIKELEDIAASRSSAIGFDLDPLNTLFPKRPTGELFAEGREAAVSLDFLNLQPLAEAVNRELNDLAERIFPPRRIVSGAVGRRV